MTIGDVVVYNGKYGSKPDDFLHLVTSKPWIVNGKELVQLDYKQGGRCTDDLALFPIKPCPFCGSTEIDFGFRNGGKFGGDFTQCFRCGAKIEEYFTGKCIKSINKWNRRVLELPKKHSRMIDAEQLKSSIKEHSYLLKDVTNSIDFGMYVEGIIQAINECETIVEMSYERGLKE